MSEHRTKAKKIADIFSDERTNVIDLAHQTANLLTANSEARLHNWLKWHYRLTEGYKAEVLDPVQLDNYDEN